MIRMLRDGRSGPMLNTLRFACFALLLVLLHDVSLDSAWGQTGLRRRLQPPPPPAVASKVDSASTLGKALSTCDKVQEDQFVLPGLKGEIRLDHCYRVTCPCRFPPVEVRVRPSEGRTDETSQVYGRSDYWRAARA
jgi:hypothetical protein